MKKILITSLILSISFNIFLIYLFVFKGNTKVTEDNRVSVIMSEQNKDFALEEMREFLNAVNQIHNGIANGNKEQIINAAGKSGGNVIDHAPKGLIKALPLDFKKLGFATHDIFDEIRDSAQVNFKPEITNKQLTKLLNNCVACHAIYKIETK